MKLDWQQLNLNNFIIQVFKMDTLHPQPRTDHRNLASRLAALEDKLERSNTINRIPIAETLKRRKEELEKDTFQALEELSNIN